MFVMDVEMNPNPLNIDSYCDSEIYKREMDLEYIFHDVNHNEKHIKLLNMLSKIFNWKNEHGPNRAL